jgi:hypothetical protein
MDYFIRKEVIGWTVLKWDTTPLENYTVHQDRRNGRWSCTCPQNRYRKTGCKHIDMVLQCVARGTPQPFVVERSDL